MHIGCTKTLEATKTTHFAMMHGYNIIGLKYFLLLQFIKSILEYSSSYTE